MRQFFVVIISLMAIFGLTSKPAHGADATVLVCDFATLSTAVTTANTGGGVITFACSGTIVFASRFTINANVTINENGNTVIFDGNNATAFFVVASGGSLTVNGFTFQNGFGSTYGAIGGNNSSNITVSNSTFINNRATVVGGAIRSDAVATITNSTFTNNTSNFGGAVHGGEASNLTITGSTFTTNSANRMGGAINTDNILSISNSTFTGNSALEFGGAVRTDPDSSATISGSTFTNNTASIGGGAIYNNDGNTPIAVSGSLFINNTCGIASTNFTDGGNNFVDAASTNCPGALPTTLMASAVCNGDDLDITITSGDAPFSISVTDSGGTMDVGGQPLGVYTYSGPNTFSNIGVTEDTGDLQTVTLETITCPSALPPAPLVEVAPAVTVLGCALDTADGVELANAPDNTYCRVLMKDGGVVSYSGAVPQNLVDLGVIFAVDVYRLNGGQAVTEFPDYTQICLSGAGRMFYLDARLSPRDIIEMTTENINGMTCAWIPATGTLVLTN